MYDWNYVRKFWKYLNTLVEEIIFLYETGFEESQFDFVRNEAIPLICKYSETEEELYESLTYFKQRATLHRTAKQSLYRLLFGKCIEELRAFCIESYNSSFNNYWRERYVAIYIYNLLAEHGLELEWLLNDLSKVA